MGAVGLGWTLVDWVKKFQKAEARAEKENTWSSDSGLESRCNIF